MVISDAIQQRILNELKRAPRGEVYLWRLSGLTAYDLTALLEGWLQQGVIERLPGGMVSLTGWKEEPA